MSASPEIRVTLPDGTLLRTRSTRRYVVAVRAGWHDDRWLIDYRTDTESKALARWRAECRRGVDANVIDTVDKAVIR